MVTSNAQVAARTEVRAVITRADGTVQDCGLISAKYRNPIRQAYWVLVGSRLAHRRIRRINRTHQETP